MRDRWAALYVLCAGMLMIVLDVTVVNVALPSIQTDLGFSDAGLAWVVNAYLIAFAGLLLLAGRLGDLLGRRRVLVGGLVLFTASSLVCGAATSQELLVGARFVQGIGGAMASAVTLGMIVTMFPGDEQAKALGVYGFVASSGGAVGLVAGGVITQSVNWHWIFFVNVPLGVLTVVLVRRWVPADEGIGLAAGADVPGAVLVTAALMVGVYSLISTSWALGALSLVLLALFVWRQATAATPLMPLRLFSSRTTVGANLVQVLTVAGMFGMFFLQSLYLEKVLDYSPLQIGLAFLPATLVMAGLSLRVSDKVVHRFGAQPVLVVGSAVVAAALGLLVLAPVDGSYLTDLLPAYALLGVGTGVAFPALMGIAMADATESDAGLASGLVNTTAQSGGAVGLAVLATLAASKAGAGSPAELVSGYHAAFAVASLMLVAATVVAATLCRTPSDEPVLVAG